MHPSPNPQDITLSQVEMKSPRLLVLPYVSIIAFCRFIGDHAWKSVKKATTVFTDPVFYCDTFITV